MGRTIRIFAPLLLAGVPHMAQAQTVTLSPSTVWQSEGDTARCRVSRVFGEGNARHILMIEQFHPDDRVTMTLGGPALDDFTDAARAQLDLTGGEAPRWVAPISGAVEGFGPGLKLSGIPVGTTPEQYGEAGRVRQSALPQASSPTSRPAEFITLAQRGRKLRLQTGDLDGALATLDACAQALAAGWGLDVARLQSASTGPQWINRAAIHRRIAVSFAEHWRYYSPVDGVAHVRVIVDEAGQPEHCATVYATSGMAPNEQACRIMQQARFEPARDSEGKPVRSFYSASFKDRRRGASADAVGGRD
jgi:hypothetical protein